MANRCSVGLVGRCRERGPPVAERAADDVREHVQADGQLLIVSTAALTANGASECSAAAPLVGLEGRQQSGQGKGDACM